MTLNTIDVLSTGNRNEKGCARVSVSVLFQVFGPAHMGLQTDFSPHHPGFPPINGWQREWPTKSVMG